MEAYGMVLFTVVDMIMIMITEWAIEVTFIMIMTIIPQWSNGHVSYNKLLWSILVRVRPVLVAVHQWVEIINLVVILRVAAEMKKRLSV
jgi:hypothetical protein